MREKQKEIMGLQKSVKWTIYGAIGKIEFYNCSKRQAIKKYREFIKFPQIASKQTVEGDD